jgi:hypothetical protein
MLTVLGVSPVGIFIRVPSCPFAVEIFLLARLAMLILDPLRDESVF